MFEWGRSKPNEKLAVANVHFLCFQRYSFTHHLLPTRYHRYLVEFALQPVRFQQSLDAVLQGYNIALTGVNGGTRFFQGQQV